MTPKGIDLGIYGRSQGSMDIRIKDFSNTTSSALDFFNTAMLWAAEKIDFEHATLYPEPSAWKYKVRRKNSPANRTEADDLIVQSNELKNQAIPLWRTDKLEYLNLMLRSYELKLKAADLKADTRWKSDIQTTIDRINDEIKKLQQ